MKSEAIRSLRDLQTSSYLAGLMLTGYLGDPPRE